MSNSKGRVWGETLRALDKTGLNNAEMRQVMEMTPRSWSLMGGRFHDAVDFWEARKPGTGQAMLERNLQLCVFGDGAGAFIDATNTITLARVQRGGSGRMERALKERRASLDPVEQNRLMDEAFRRMGFFNEKPQPRTVRRKPTST
jgi:hypothetical protein